jgi:hypothetical protein
MKPLAEELLESPWELLTDEERARVRAHRMRRPEFASEEWFAKNAEKPDAASATERPRAGGGRKTTIADALVELAADVELTHTPAGVAYATVHVGEHRETHAVTGRGLRRWLARRYWGVHRGAPPAESLRQALAVLDAQAIYDGEEREVYLRVAPGPDGAVWLDLADAAWHAVRVDAAGWAVVSDPPVRFRRAAGMLALPTPTGGGDLAELVELLPGAEADEPRALLLGWLVAALRPMGPYPILHLHGEQGSGKSTTSRMVRGMVDPAQAALRAPPREVRDLSIASNNGWVVAYDNLSGVPDWLSDALCRLATGGGFATRELYSDTDETIIDATRPAIVNGIDSVATRGDLLDRALLVTLPTIERYAPETELWRRYDAARPRMLGALLDAVSLAIRREHEVTVPPRLRLADAARWVEAAEPALPVKPGAWITAYSGVRAEGHQLALEGSLVGPALRSLASEPAGWSGTAAALLAELGRRDPDAAHRKGWPATPQAASTAVRRLAPALRAIGVMVEFDRDPGRGRRRLIRLGGSQAAASERPERPTRPNGAPSEAQTADGRTASDASDDEIPASAAPTDEGVL